MTLSSSFHFRLRYARGLTCPQCSHDSDVNKTWEINYEKIPKVTWTCALFDKAEKMVFNYPHRCSYLNYSRFVRGFEFREIKLKLKVRLILYFLFIRSSNRRSSNRHVRACRITRLRRKFAPSGFRWELMLSMQLLDPSRCAELPPVCASLWLYRDSDHLFARDWTFDFLSTLFFFSSTRPAAVSLEGFAMQQR